MDLDYDLHLLKDIIQFYEGVEEELNRGGKQAPPFQLSKYKECFFYYCPKKRKFKSVDILILTRNLESETLRKVFQAKLDQEVAKRIVPDLKDSF